MAQMERILASLLIQVQDPENVKSLSLNRTLKASNGKQSFNGRNTSNGKKASQMFPRCSGAKDYLT